MKSILLFSTICCLPFFSNTQTVLPKIGLQVFSQGFYAPLDIENCGDPRLFIVEQSGKIWMADSNGNKSSQPFIDLGHIVSQKGGEQGLLGLAFDPQYKSNGFFYVNYIDSNDNTQISRFSVSQNNPDVADVQSEKKLLNISHVHVNHNGGCLKFGLDGYLYIGMGDSGGAGDPLDDAQNKKSFLGKMLRIDVENGTTYAIPPTNPFINDTSYLPEIWMLGVRNPWRFSFDRFTGNLWIADVGQDKWEEVNFYPVNDSGGENNGWSCYEGNYPYLSDRCSDSSSLTFPIAEYSHFDSSASITGGYVYRGLKFPNMYGKYFCTDYVTGQFRTVFPENGTWQTSTLLLGDPASYVSFGENSNAELFLADIANGVIYHVIDSLATGVSTINLFQNNFLLYPNPSSDKVIISLNAERNEVCELTVSNETGENFFSEYKNIVRGKNSWEISTKNFPKGTYLLQIRAADGFVNKKFIVE